MHHLVSTLGMTCRELQHCSGNPTGIPKLGPSIPLGTCAYSWGPQVQPPILSEPFCLLRDPHLLSDQTCPSSHRPPEMAPPSPQGPSIPLGTPRHGTHAPQGSSIPSGTPAST